MDMKNRATGHPLWWNVQRKREMTGSWGHICGHTDSSLGSNEDEGEVVSRRQGTVGR